MVKMVSKEETRTAFLSPWNRGGWGTGEGEGILPPVAQRGGGEQRHNHGESQLEFGSLAERGRGMTVGGMAVRHMGKT